MNLSKTTLLLLALTGLALFLVASSASADQGNENWEDAIDIYGGTRVPNSGSSTVSSQASGNLDDDWFRIDLNNGQFLKLSMFITDTNDGLCAIDVYGPDDATNLLTFSRWGNRNVQEIDLPILRNGTYYVKVWVHVQNSASYWMEVMAWTPPILQSGVAVTNPATPPPDLTLRGGFMSGLWYRLWLEGGNQTVEKARATVTWDDAADAHLIVYDRRDDYRLNILNYSWSKNHDHSESCEWAASYTGYYFVRVWTNTFADSQTKFITFRLTANVLPEKHLSDGNVVKGDAELVEIQKTVSGKIVQAYDTHDWYRFFLKKGERFSAKADLYNHNLADHYDFYTLTVYAHNGTRLAEGDNVGSDGQTPIYAADVQLLTAPYSGMYYLAISAHNSYSGSNTDLTGGKLRNTARYDMLMLIPNRQVWIVDPPGEIRMDEDGEYELDLTSIFWDPENDNLRYGVSGNTQNFTLPLSSGKLIIKPKDDWHGVDKINIWAHDGRPQMKNITTVTITVRSVPDPPVVLPSAPSVVRIKEDEVNTTALDLRDVFHDVDVEDKVLVFSSDKNEFINIEINPTGQVTLWGIEDYNGEQKVNFYATDYFNYRKAHEIKIRVLPVNDAPVTMGKIPRLSMKEGSVSNIDVGPYFFDIDGDDLYYYVTWDKEDAINFDNADSNPLNSWFDIYPEDPNFYGYVQVTFECYDRDRLDPEAEPEVAIQTAILEVENVNDAPRIDGWEPDYDPTIQETESVIFKVAQHMIYDVDSTNFKWRWFVNNEEMVEVTGESLEFPVDPSYGDEGTYVIRCEIKDNLGEPANIAPEWTLTIENKNRAPNVYLISKDSEVSEGSKIRLRADGNDPDDDSLIFEWYKIDDVGREQSVGFGRDYSMDKPLLPGAYKFKCYVNDGKSNVGSELVTVEVKAHEFPPTIPGFGAFLLVGALMAGMAMAVATRRRP